tara:strand:- start:8478 stop:17933 length:9456 start_codon:yes stop_codon:yes gene_type:complete
MDEKYIEDVFTQLGGESKFGSFSDFKDLMHNDAQYRKDFHASIGEDTLGKFGDFENLVKKNGGQVSETGGQVGTSPAQSPSQLPLTSEEPKQPGNPPGSIDDGFLKISEQWRYREGMPTIDKGEPIDEVSLALSAKKHNQKAQKSMGLEKAFDVYYNKQKQSQYEQKLRESGIDEKGQAQILNELNGIPDELYDREFSIETGEKIKPYNKEFLGRIRKENYPYYINRVNAIKNDYNLEKEGDKKASNQLANVWNETGMSKLDEFNNQEPEGVVNNLNKLNEYTTQASDIITTASSKNALGFKTTDESLNNLKQGAGTYISSSVTPDIAKSYLSTKIGTDGLELKNQQQALSSAITGQPVPEQDLDGYTLSSIKSKLDPNSVVDQMVFDVYSQKTALEDAFQSATSIEEAAMNYRKAIDPEFNAQITALEGDVNKSTIGETVDSFISDPAVQEYVKKDPALVGKLFETKMKFNKDFPEFAKSKLLQTLGSEYQKEYANWFANNPTTDKLDVIVDKLRNEGKISDEDVKTYKEEIVPKQQLFWKTVRGLTTPIGGSEWFKEDVVPTADFMSGLTSGIYGTLKNVAGSMEQASNIVPNLLGLENPLFSNKKLINDALADRTTAQVDPVGFAGTMYGIGNITGFAATLGLMGIPAGAMGLTGEAAHLIPTALAFYEENKKEALLKIPGNTFADNVQRQLLTGSNLAVDLYLTKVLDINKISKGAANLLKNDISEVIGKLRTGSITQAKAGEEVWNKMKDFGVRYLGNSMKTTATINSFTAAHDVVNKLFNAGGKELPEITDDYINNFIPTLKSTVLLSLASSIKPGEKLTVGKTLLDMANNPEYYREMINKKYGDNPKLQNEKQELLSNLDQVTAIRNTYSDPIFKDLTDAQKQKIMLLRMQANLYADKATSTQDPTASKTFLDKSNELSKQIEGITKGKDKALDHENPIPATSPTTSTELAPEIKQGESVADVEAVVNNFQNIIKDSEEILKQNPEDTNTINAVADAKIKLEALKKDPVKYFEDEKAKTLEDLNKALESGTPREELSIDEVTSNYDNLIKQAKAYGEKNAAGVSGVVGKGQTTQQGEPIQGGGTETTGAGGVLQTQGAEGEGGGVGEKVGEVTGVAQEQVVKQMKPLTDKMVDIEREFNNSGYEINTDYDNEIQVLDKNGEQVEPDELPDNLKKLAADYEKATSKLGEFDASAREKALNQSRGIVDTEAEVVETKQAELPQQKVKFSKTSPTASVETTAKALEDKLKQEKSSIGVQLRRLVGLITHGGEDVISKFDFSKIKGGVRGRYGKGIYFSNLFKNYDYGSKSTFLKSKELNLMNGDMTVSEALNKLKLPSDVRTKISKLESLLSKVKNNKDYNEISKEIEDLKSQQSRFDENTIYIQKALEAAVKEQPNLQFSSLLESLESRVIESNNLNKSRAVKGLEDSFNNFLLESGFDGVNVGDGHEIVLIPQEKINNLLVSSQENFIAEEYYKAKEDGSNPKLVNAVEDLIGKQAELPQQKGEGVGEVKTEATEQKEPEKTKTDSTENIVDEMNMMGGVNINVSLNDIINKIGKLKTKLFKRKGIVKKPNVVSISDFNGIPIMVTISDELTTGQIINPITGEVIGDLKGGIGFNYSKGNTEYAWAYTNEKTAKDVLAVAKKMYEQNPDLYPDGIVPVAVVKMGKSAMVSNEAVIRQVIQNLTDSKIPEQNKTKAFEVIKSDIQNQLDVVNARISKAKSEGTEPTPSDAATSRGYVEILKLIDKSKSFDDLLKNVDKLNIGTRPLLINRFTSGNADIVPADNRMSIDKPATIALMEGLPKSEYKRINLGHLVNNLVDPSLSDVPDKHIISFVGIDAKADAPVKINTHPNYPYALKGKGLGVLDKTVHIGSVMPAAYANIVNKLLKAEESGKPVTEEQMISSGLPAALNNEVFRNKPLSQKILDYNKLVGYLQLAFPNSQFFTDPKTWEDILSSDGVKKYVKDGEVVYGLTKDGHIYLNPNYDSLNTPIHEVGHLHIDLLENTNPELFNKGISLVEGTDALKSAIQEYGEDGIAARKEALAILIGNKGESIVDAAMKSKFKEWLVAVYKYIQSKFPSLKSLTPEQIADLTLDQFINGSLKDILGAKEVESKKPKQKGAIEDKAEVKFSKKEKEGNGEEPPTEEPKEKAPEEDPEMTKMANAVNDAFVEGKFGTDVLDKIIAKLQDTDTAKIYNTVREKIKSGVLTAKEVRDRIITTKQGSEADQAVLMYDLAELKGKESGLMNEMIGESDPAKQADIARKLLDVQNEMQENALANRYLGRTASSIFRLRQLWVNREMDLATMEKQFMSSKGVESLTPEQSKEVKNAYNKIKETKTKLDNTKQELDNLIQKDEVRKAEENKLNELKQQAKLKEKEDRNRKAQEKISASIERMKRIKANLRSLRGNMSSGVDPKIAIEIGKLAAEKFYQKAVKLDVLVKDILAEVKDIYPNWTENDVRNHLFPDLKDANKYFSEDKDYKSSKKELRDKIDEYKKLQAEYAKTLFQWQKDRRTDLADKRTWSEKLADKIYQWQRFAVLTYPTTFVKLAAVVGHNLLLKPFRFGYQKVIANAAKVMSKDFAGKMGVYGDPSLKAMAKYYSEFIRNFSLSNLKEQFSGIDTKEVLYGDKFMYDEWSAGKGLLEMPGRSHGYIKSFVKNPEFQFAHEMLVGQAMTKMAEIGKQMENPKLTPEELAELKKEYDNNDVTNEDVLMRINKLSLEHGKDAILMGDNKTVEKFRELTKGSGAASTFLKTEAPIVKIPLNYISRALLTKYGLMQAITGKSFGTESSQHPSVAKLIFKGTEGLTEAQGQALSKAIMYGSMGATMFALGYFNKDKVKLNDDGSIEFNGMHISKNLIHVPEFESFFSGVETAHKFKEEKSKLNWIESFLLSDLDVIKKNPFLSMLEYGLIGGIIKASTDKNMKDESKLKMLEDAATNKVINIAIPGFSKQLAQWMDTEEGKGIHPMGTPIKRKPQGDWGERFVQSLEMAIPGLRQRVPTGEGKKTFDEKQITESGILKRYQKLGVEFKEIPAPDKLGISEPLTPEQYDKFVEAYQKEIKIELLALADKEFQQTTEKEVDGETEKEPVSGTENTNIGMLSKKFSELEIEKEKKGGKKESALQNKVDEILSTARNKVLVRLKYKKPTKSWEEY